MCNCSYQGPGCLQGKRQFEVVSRFYQRLMERTPISSPTAREQLWQAYESARAAYVAHLHQRTVS